MLYRVGKYNLLSYGTAIGYLHPYFLAAFRFRAAKFLGEESTLTLRWLMSYIYGAPILDVSRSHTTTQHSR